MAEITKSVGTATRDYSTITLWEADLDDDTPYDAGDAALGELYDDSAFDESCIINDGGTLGLISVTLTAATGEAHDGTAGTGARLVMTANRSTILGDFSDQTMPIDMSFFEYDVTDQDPNGSVVSVDYSSTLRSCLVHDFIDGNSASTGIKFISENSDHAGAILNDVVYNCASDSDLSVCYGIDQSDNTPDGNIFIRNNTVFNVTNAGTASAFGIGLVDDANVFIQNNISTDSDDGDYQNAAPSNATLDHNLASDTTASGTGSLDSKAAADQFVSTTGGSEDLHLKAGADAIDVATDFVTTPTHVNIDINGRDRDAEADTWDMGAHELVAAPADDPSADTILFTLGQTQPRFDPTEVMGY